MQCKIPDSSSDRQEPSTHPCTEIAYTTRQPRDKILVILLLSRY